jgi:hypothetical protein
VAQVARAHDASVDREWMSQPLRTVDAMVEPTVATRTARTAERSSRTSNLASRTALRVALEALTEFVRGAEPGALRGDEAREVVTVLAEIERTCASGIALLSPRVVETGSYAKAGFATASDWLAACAGSSSAAAKARLNTAERAATIPEVAGALHEGTLSSAQLSVVTSAAGADPEAAGTLLEMAATAGHQELADEASRLRACARSKETEQARRARVHASRHLRWRQAEGGGVRGEFLCDEVAWARVAPALEAATKARAKAAGAGCVDSYEAHRLDALLDLLSRQGTSGSRPRVLVHVDAEALRRGTTTTGEICEIAGIGPVAVAAVTELLGEGSMEFLVKEGADVRTVTKASRHLAQKTASALVARDRTCVVPGCGKSLGLQGDHCIVDYAAGGPTEIENLALLCPGHHDMKTHGGWKIVGGPGRWKWVRPKDPPSAGRIARARKVAAARANPIRS